MNELPRYYVDLYRNYPHKPDHITPKGEPVSVCGMPLPQEDYYAIDFIPCFAPEHLCPTCLEWTYSFHRLHTLAQDLDPHPTICAYYYPNL